MGFVRAFSKTTEKVWQKAQMEYEFRGGEADLHLM